MEELTEDEKRALRGSKFAPLTSLPSSSRSQLPRFLFQLIRDFCSYRFEIPDFPMCYVYSD